MCIEDESSLFLSIGTGVILKVEERGEATGA